MYMSYRWNLRGNLVKPWRSCHYLETKEYIFLVAFAMFRPLTNSNDIVITKLVQLLGDSRVSLMNLKMQIIAQKFIGRGSTPEVSWNRRKGAS